MKKIYYLCLLLVIAGTGCTPFKMSVSDELKNSNDEYVVKGKNGTRIRQQLSFGDYRTQFIKRSWTRGTDFKYGAGYRHAVSKEWINIISEEYIDKKQSIRFEMTQGEQHAAVFCVSRFNAKDIEVGRNPNSLLNIGMDILGIGGQSSSNYYVQIYVSDKDGGRPWEMAIDNQLSQARPKEYIGYLAKSPEEYYSIVPVTKLEKNGKSGNTLFGAVGFEFRNSGGQAVAAVSLMEKGMVFLAKTNAEERFLLANACAALLLQDVID